VKRLGITGTLASGKSTVGGLFERWGARRLDADVLARQVVEPGTEGLRRIREMWGDRVIAEDGSLDRAALRRQVFDDRDARRQLEGIVHGEVRRLRGDWRAAMAQAGARVLVEEVPLLYETGLEDEYDAIIVVDAPAEVRAERALGSRGWSLEEFRAIDASQMASDRKQARADYVIYNDGDLEALERTARETWDSVCGIDAIDSAT